MRSDDEIGEVRRLRGQLGALDADIQTARRDLERATTAHFEEYFQGAPLRRPPDHVDGEPMRLRDGATVMVRPVEPADSSLLEEGFHDLSAVTRYRRFLFDRPDLTGEEARELTQLDHRDHEAIIAIDPKTGDGVGIARYVRDDADRACAVAGITVIDRWQGRGLGTELLGRLAARARDAGIERFEAHMIAGDAEAQRMFEHLGPVETSQRSRGTLDVTVRLAR
ncbi:MAG TPA: GNAT family N-acetyltransferase [Thermoleophilaceae bacterium]|jgi:GNAT superfamily N-acetyltransferase|nr:GNAT family N-acetyltransferase [Thermoleophilaceae bacterium]